MIRHQRLELVGGDDWVFNEVLVDANGNPIDLTGATVQWTLLDSFGFRALMPTDFTITLGTPIGSATVKVAATRSTKVVGGGYADYWRVTTGGVTQTTLTGAMSVLSDPFAAPIEPALVVITGQMAAHEAADGFSAMRANVVDVSTYRRRRTA
jgi:hypothetical protein